MLVEFDRDDLAAARRRHADRRDAPAVRHPRRGAGRDGGARAADRRGDRREEGKPEQALPKIVEGRVNGFFKDVVLLEQPSVQDQKKTVKQVLDEAGVEVRGSPASRSASPDRQDSAAG